MYAAAFLHNDDGDLVPLFEAELKGVADSLLRRARWQSSDSAWPSVGEIAAMARGEIKS